MGHAAHLRARPPAPHLSLLLSRRAHPVPSPPTPTATLDRLAACLQAAHRLDAARRDVVSAGARLADAAHRARGRYQTRPAAGSGSGSNGSGSGVMAGAAGNEGGKAA